MRRVHQIVCVTAVSILLLSPLSVEAGTITFADAEANAAALAIAVVDPFRMILGNPNNANTPGPLPGGRREINWDGGGTATTLNETPLTTFQNIRGALFSTVDGLGPDFVQAPLSAFGTTDFQVFSAPRLFAPINSSITDVTFFLPGSGGAVPAFVVGFGAIFTDVDSGESTSLEFYDLNNLLLTVVPAPALDGGLSFAGAFFDAGERIGRVRMISGGLTDVGIDDVLYSEPVPVPEPGTLALLGLGLFGIQRALQRRKPQKR